MESKVVAHTLEGKVHRGLTHDFGPDAEFFHLLPAEGGGVPVRVRLSELKALFYVRDYFGNRDYRAPGTFGSALQPGRRCIATFIDGEVIFGTSPDYQEGRVGFTLFPSDPDDNNVRIFVMAHALRDIRFP